MSQGRAATLKACFLLRRIDEHPQEPIPELPATDPTLPLPKCLCILDTRTDGRGMQEICIKGTSLTRQDWINAGNHSGRREEGDSKLGETREEKQR